MSQGKTYSKIDTTRTYPGNKRSELESERQPITFRFAPIEGGQELQARVSRYLQKQSVGKEIVEHTFLCFKREGSSCCESNSHSVKETEWPSSSRERHNRTPQSKMRRDWCQTIELNCAAVEREMKVESDIQKNMLDGDSDKVKITAACGCITHAISTFWYSRGWLVSVLNTEDGRLWVLPESKFESIDAAKNHLESRLAPRPSPFSSLFEDEADASSFT